MPNSVIYAGSGKKICPVAVVPSFTESRSTLLLNFGRKEDRENEGQKLKND